MEDHLAGVISPGSPVHEPDRIDDDEYDEERAEADHLVRPAFVRLRLRMLRVLGRFLAGRCLLLLVLIIPLVLWQDDVTGFGDVDWFRAGLWHLDVQEFREVRKRKVLQREV